MLPLIKPLDNEGKGGLLLVISHNHELTDPLPQGLALGLGFNVVESLLVVGF